MNLRPVETLAIPYLPSIQWYRSYVAHMLGAVGTPRLPQHFCRATVVAPFGRCTLSVPVEGGRRLITASRYSSLTLSEHGNWRHTHWNTIASAYGSTPFFHYFAPELEAIYSRRFSKLSDLCAALHNVIDNTASLTTNISWLCSHPGTDIHAASPQADDPSLSILHLLCLSGPLSIFALLPPGFNYHKPASTDVI